MWASVPTLSMDTTVGPAFTSVGSPSNSYSFALADISAKPQVSFTASMNLSCAAAKAASGGPSGSIALAADTTADTVACWSFGAAASSFGYSASSPDESSLPATFSTSSVVSQNVFDAVVVAFAVVVVDDASDVSSPHAAAANANTSAIAPSATRRTDGFSTWCLSPTPA